MKTLCVIVGLCFGLLGAYLADTTDLNAVAFVLIMAGFVLGFVAPILLIADKRNE